MPGERSVRGNFAERINDMHQSIAVIFVFTITRLSSPRGAPAFPRR
jgi:hypothetical protein